MKLKYLILIVVIYLSTILAIIYYSYKNKPSKSTNPDPTKLEGSQSEDQLKIKLKNEFGAKGEKLALEISKKMELAAKMYMEEHFKIKEHIEPDQKFGDGYTLNPHSRSGYPICGSIKETPDGSGLLFGGFDKENREEPQHTQIKKNDKWVSIYDKLKKNNVLQKYHDQLWSLRNRQKNILAKFRFIYFKGLNEEETNRLISELCLPEQEIIIKEIKSLNSELLDTKIKLPKYETIQVDYALQYLDIAIKDYNVVMPSLKKNLKNTFISNFHEILLYLEKASETLNCEPPPRILSPIAYDAKTKLFVIFGGDHIDYMTNDTWVFDSKILKWMQRHPKAAPSPRFNHLLTTEQPGKINLNFGCGSIKIDSQKLLFYDSQDGECTYDIENDIWSGHVESKNDVRTYLPDKFQPESYLFDPPPNAESQEKLLNNIPYNSWIDLDTKKLLKTNSWQSKTIAYDPKRDLILCWSHGFYLNSSNISHYHLSTNRWEIPNPSENYYGTIIKSFNFRPEIIGTCSYDYILNKMIYNNPKLNKNYLYNIDNADWEVNNFIPKDSSIYYEQRYYFYGTPFGTFAWNSDEKLLQYNYDTNEFIEMPLKGYELIKNKPQNFNLIFDSKRNRFLWLRQSTWQTTSDCEFFEINLKDFEIKNLILKSNTLKLDDFKFNIIHSVYDSQNDCVFFATTIKINGNASQKLLMYDCATNRWSGINIKKESLIHNLGSLLDLVYDAKRNLIWAIDGDKNVFVLKIDLKTANIVPLENQD